MRGRIKGETSQVYRQEIVLPGLKANYHAMFHEMMLANIAQVVMLYNQRIIKKSDAVILLKSLKDIDLNFTEDDLNPVKDDLYFNIEQALISKVGSDIGGKMHTGRSRNDLYSALNRMVMRKNLLEVMSNNLKLQDKLLELSDKYKDTVFTGYTHLQPAQPITLGYYFVSYLEALQRDFDRLKSSFEVTNQCPLGACALAGTGFCIDRESISKMLGFDSIIMSNLDSIASRDYLLQAESSIAIMMSTMSRIAQDIQMWVTDEFSVIELGDDVSSPSSIMPQKKNPGILEYIKGKSSHSVASLVDSFMVFKGTPFSFCCDLMETASCFNNSFSDINNAIDLFINSLSSFTFKAERALEMANRNYSTVTSLADFLVGKFDISFRQAHKIVGGIVSDAKEKGVSASQINPEMVRKWSMEIIDRDLILTIKDLEDILNPSRNVETKDIPGGPKMSRVEEMINIMTDISYSQREWHKTTDKNLKSAYNSTWEFADKLIAEWEEA